MRTKLFKRGKDQIVRIPPELRFEAPTDEVDIERVGDDLIIRPIQTTGRRSLADVVEKFKAFSPGLADEIRAIGERCASLPVLDERTADEILDYDDHGVPRRQ
jgi:virulence-associated protein VagC